MTIMQQTHQGEIVEQSTEIADFRESPTALATVTRAEVDSQIATAKRYPRSLQKFLQEAKTIVAIDPELAAQCTYILPARKGGDGKAITGPSVRLAEIIAATWGNLRIVQRITDDDGRTVTAQAVAMDLERNVGYQIEVRKNVTTRDGRRYSADMVNTATMAAMSIASRNATFKVVPRAFVNIIQDEARAVARGDVRTLPDRTNRALAWFAREGVDAAKVYDHLGINGPADMTLDHLERLQGIKVAVQDGAGTLAEIFAPPAPEPSKPEGTKTQTVSAKLSEMFPGDVAPAPAEAKTDKAKKTETLKGKTAVPDNAGDAWEPPTT
jgi:hypothetical protein